MSLWIFAISGFTHIAISLVAFVRGVFVFHLPDHIRRARKGEVLSKIALVNYAVFAISGVVYFVGKLLARL